MLKDITLGQYFPTGSIIHKLDPRTKILYTVIYIVALFFAKSFLTYGIMVALLLSSIFVSKIKFKTMIRGLKPLLIVIIFTAIINVFYSKEGSVLVDFWIFTITSGGLLRAFFMVSRIIMLVMGTFLLTYTTTPMELTDGLEILLSPLKKVRFPVHELSMMMSIALRFIPTLIEEADKIMSAQKARGADFETGKLTQRAKALMPLLIPLFISAFRRADELSIAMESRCYHGGKGRTRMKVLKFHLRDYLCLLIYALILTLIIILSRFGL